ncbi:hypothetical protein HY988_05585 [Candidatus Micrarchaeota archaeon]|nr:hypothetical protein [Candidatus Micrarchaeota archaeon]
MVSQQLKIYYPTSSSILKVSSIKLLKELAWETLGAFKHRDQRRLRKLNDDILHSAALSFNAIHFRMAVFSYVLSKIVSKPRLLSHDNAPALKNIENALGMVVRSFERNDPKISDAAFNQLDRAITTLEKADPRFIVNLMTKGKLKMAATLYAQGLSLGTASEVTGMEKQEILDYAGETMMFDRLKEEKPMSERIKTARSLIGD